jgi:hypothetical protein
MRAPVRFAIRNLVFGADRDDVWALYRLELTSYEGLTSSQKKQLLADVASFAYALEADFSLLRVWRGWSGAEYRHLASLALDDRAAHRDVWDRQLDRQQALLAAEAVARPELYLAVRLAAPARAALDEFADRAGRWISSPAAALRELRRTAGFGDPAAIGETRLRELAGAEAQAFARVGDFLAAERATTLDLQWLIRRALCRGRGDPELDVHWRPQALVMLEGDELQYRPHQADVLRLFGAPVEVGERALRIRSERGDSHQALLVLGALPETVVFPGRSAELLFAPLEAVDFPVDAAFSARWLPNDQAARLVRRRVVDADNEAAEQRHGDHGPTPEAARRPHAARALEDYLSSESHPPLLQATISLAVAAGDADELEARVRRLQREYAPVRLERPYGEQLRLWCQHFPGQPSALADYEDYLLVEQLGAMVPTATHAVGSDAGPYLGHTLSGSRAPVCFDLTEPCRSALTPAVLLVGPPGRGKTATLQRLLHDRFLAGSRVIDVDPKPDHRWTDLPHVAPHTETIEFGADPRYRGMLDPLRIAPREEAEDLAVDWLLALLRADIPHAWETEVRAAVKQALTAPVPTCGLVLEQLAAGGKDAARVGRALAVYADSGLAQLGIASANAPLPSAGAKQVTALRVAGLALPELGATPATMTAKERISQALIQLVAAYALRLMAEDPTTHTVLGFDEAWVLTDTAAGRRLLRRANRLGRAQNGTPLLGTQSLGDVDEEIKELVGAVFCFGAETDAQARQLLALLDLEPGDQRLRQRLIGFRRGRCFLRDYSRRLAAIQVDFAHDPGLLDALDTTPRTAAGALVTEVAEAPA